MLRKIEKKNMGKHNLGWLRSIFHFSFDEYHNPGRMNFGVLRVLNDDLVEPGKGFDMHPHRDMEIISYVVHGELTHGDSMGNKRTITRGQVQYMSAGTGVHHSEYNYGDEVLRLLQIWIYPDHKGHIPVYGDYPIEWDLRQNKWLHIVSGNNVHAPVKINQDANIYVIELEKGNEIGFTVSEDRQAYLIQVEGTSIIDNIEMRKRDALEIVEEEIIIKAEETSHLMIIEMSKVN